MNREDLTEKIFAAVFWAGGVTLMALPVVYFVESPVWTFALGAMTSFAVEGFLYEPRRQTRQIVREELERFYAVRPLAGTFDHEKHTLK